MSQHAKRVSLTTADIRSYHPLARLRWIIRGYVFLEGMLLALSCACLWYWCALALDYGIFDLFGIDLLDRARSVRWVILGCFGAMLAFLVVWYVVRRIFRDFSPTALALVLEHRFPELLGDRLITAIELANLKTAEQYGYSIDMIKKTMIEAQERVNRVPVLKVFNWSRMALLFWGLFSVTCSMALLSYPIAVLFSLRNLELSRDLWIMFTVNLLLVLGIICYVLAPFVLIRWKKSRALFRGAAIGTAIIIGFTTYGYVKALDGMNSHYSGNEFAWRLYHGSDIVLDRDLSFKETRWPHDDYFIDWLDFPMSEKRVRENTGITARAYLCRFIVADGNTGLWRPLLWSELPAVLGEEAAIPPIALDRVHDYLMSLALGDADSKIGYQVKNLILPEMDSIKADLIMVLADDPASRLFSAAEIEQIQSLRQQLEAKAADLHTGGRVIREIKPPESMRLNYWVTRTNSTGQEEIISRPISSRMTVQDDRTNVFALEQKLKFNNPVELVVEAAFGSRIGRSDSRHVQIARAPILEELDYQEFRPAYYYYLPPTGPRVSTIDERRVLLKGLEQTMPEVKKYKPEDSVSIDIFAGSSLTVRATTDKPLLSGQVYLREITQETGSKPNESRVPVPIESDGKSITLNFNPQGNTIEELSSRFWLSTLPWKPTWAQKPSSNPIFAPINRTMTLELRMIDIDNIESSKTITIVPAVDNLPTVNLVIHPAIRKLDSTQTSGKNNQGSYYVVTARAEIPFTRESRVEDDFGLHKVDVAYGYRPLANSTKVIQMASLASWLWASSPVNPTIAEFLYRREVLLRTVGDNSQQEIISNTSPISAFAEEQARQFGQPVPTIDQLKGLLSQPLDTAYQSPVLRRFDFVVGDKGISFDIDNKLPDLQKKNPTTGEQTWYELTLNVNAVDSNVLSPESRVGTFKGGTLTFRLVPEPELLKYIARDESKLGKRLDDVINLLVIQQRSLQSINSRLPTLSGDSAPVEQTRVESMRDTLEKTRSSVDSIATDYSNIIDEYRFNRCDRKLSDGLTEKIRDPLRNCLAKEFTQTDNALTTFIASLAAIDQNASLQTGALAQTNLAALIDALRNIRKQIADTLDIKEKLLELQRLIDEEARSLDACKQLETEFIRRLLSIQLRAPQIVTLDQGQTTKLAFPVQMPLTITVQPPKFTVVLPDKSELKAPAEVLLSESSAEAGLGIDFRFLFRWQNRLLYECVWLVLDLRFCHFFHSVRQSPPGRPR